MTQVWKTKTIALAYPIKIGEGTPEEKTITEIVMREPDADCLEKIEATGIMDMAEGETLSLRQVRSCVSALSGVDDKTLGKLHYKDLTALGGEIAPLLTGSEAGGEPSVQ